jgi:hypothetical protein
MKRPNGHKSEDQSRKTTAHKGRSAPADPAEFEKNTTPVRERMARDIKETPPEERLKHGR